MLWKPTSQHLLPLALEPRQALRQLEQFGCRLTPLTNTKHPWVPMQEPHQ